MGAIVAWLHMLSQRGDAFRRLVAIAVTSRMCLTRIRLCVRACVRAVCLLRASLD